MVQRLCFYRYITLIKRCGIEFFLQLFEKKIQYKNYKVKFPRIFFN